MATIVSFHAHPDDESIATGGTLAKAAEAGHRVVLVFGTRGELGEPVEGVLAEGEQLTLRRTAECFASAAALGATRVEFLGWTDSGMMGLPDNDQPWCFWQADVDHAAERLALILREEDAAVLTIYDDIGGYGHPDHIQVHRVGRRAADLAGTPIVVQTTINRDHIKRSFAMAEEFGIEPPRPSSSEEGEPGELEEGFGKPEDVITHTCDVTAYVPQKRASMRSHASQIGPDHFMASMPDVAFDFVFGTEWFILDRPVPDPAPPIFDELFVPIR